MPDTDNWHSGKATAMTLIHSAIIWDNVSGTGELSLSPGKWHI